MSELAAILTALSALGGRLDDIANAVAEVSRLRFRDADLIARLHEDVTGDTEVDLAELAHRGRYVGTGQRRVVNEDAGRKPVTYTSVTVDGGQAVAGPSVAHLPVAAPSNAAVSDTRTEIVLTFTLPPGVTEAVVVGRRDAPPTGPADPAAQTWSATNTRLEIDGGLHIPAPQDGLGWYFSIHSVLRDGSAKFAAPTGVQLKARDSTPVTASYTVRRAAWSGGRSSSR